MSDIRTHQQLSPPSHLFFFNDTATTEIYTLSLHDALPISVRRGVHNRECRLAHQHGRRNWRRRAGPTPPVAARSEEHTSELQSRSDLVCRLLLEKKKNHYDVQEEHYVVDEHVTTRAAAALL